MHPPLTLTTCARFVRSPAWGAANGKSGRASKSRQKPAQMDAAQHGIHCEYVDAFLYVIDEYELDLTAAERSGIEAKCSE